MAQYNLITDDELKTLLAVCERWKAVSANHRDHLNNDECSAQEAFSEAARQYFGAAVRELHTRRDARKWFDLKSEEPPLHVMCICCGAGDKKSWVARVDLEGNFWEDKNTFRPRNHVSHWQPIPPDMLYLGLRICNRGGGAERGSAFPFPGDYTHNSRIAASDVMVPQDRLTDEELNTLLAVCQRWEVVPEDHYDNLDDAESLALTAYSQEAHLHLAAVVRELPTERAARRWLEFSSNIPPLNVMCIFSGSYDEHSWAGYMDNEGNFWEDAVTWKPRNQVNRWQPLPPPRG